MALKKPMMAYTLQCAQTEDLFKNSKDDSEEPDEKKEKQKKEAEKQKNEKMIKEKISESLRKTVEKMQAKKKS